MDYLELVEYTKSLFVEKANTADAEKFEAYMKGHFKFYGVRSPMRKHLQKQIKNKIQNLDADSLLIYAENMWKEKYRELHYTAVDMLTYRKKFWNVDHLDRIENLITTNSWWDTVDALAPNIAGHVFYRFPKKSMSTIEKWNNSENMWLNRSAIIHQLRYKSEINLELLFAIIETHIGSKEFFINKAIGWSLRQASKYYPSAIKQFIDEHPDLSPLSIREGSKYL